MRPVCKACNQRPAAINYNKDGVTHYRNRCDMCTRRGRKEKIPVERWKSAGYKKKPTCDRCGFKARFASQLLVYHIDGRLHNAALTNLRTICLNCVEEVKRSDPVWKQGDLAPDV